ncbi:MAG: DEAD/DEAH box helicase, partial [Opitutales bacterium]|nr:DEAD/DEAH box helicase [Opitutales bacterium]
MPISDLPIESIRSELKSTFQQYKRFVLEAPTGSGKSTQTPQMLIDEGIVTKGTIVMLQPRRLAARMLAKRISWERKTKLGEEVGYQIRFENNSSEDSKIVLLTEGILLRKMLSDPKLTGISAILFDEFHERNLFSDLTLAKAKLLQETHRPDLLIGVMSATLDGEGLQHYLAPCARLQCKGRTFPVEVSYTTSQKNNREIPAWEKAANVFESTAKAGQTGNILIFMPGAYEISQTIRHIESKPISKQYEVLSLHGELPPEKQDRAFSESANPKVIVATNVAETSLTIPGISVVIDSGQARIPSYDPNRGVNTLLVQPISQASAEQRAGRAGREGPGRCIRL